MTLAKYFIILIQMTPSEFGTLLKSLDTRGNFLIAGEEDWLKERFLARIIELVLAPETRDFNYCEFSAKELEGFEQLASAVYTLPTFSSRRIVILREPENLKPGDKEKLLKLTAPASTCFILISRETSLPLRGLKGLEKKFRSYLFPALKESEISSWLKYFLVKLEKDAAVPVLMYLAENLPPNLFTIRNEIEKLASFVGNKKFVTIEDASEIISGREPTIYRFLQALRSRNEKESIELSLKLQTLGESGMYFIYAVANELLLLLKIKLLKELGKNPRAIASELKINPYVARQIISDADNFKTDELRSLISEIYNLEIMFKRGEIAERLIPTMFTSMLVKEAP